jgi:5'-nucleotidase
MSRVPGGWREVLRPRHLALPVAALAVIALGPLSQGGASPVAAPPAPAAAGWNPLTPATVSFERGLPQGPAAGAASKVGTATKAAAPTANATALSPATLELLGFNDLHGNLDPPSGSGGLITGIPVGGAEYLSATVKRLRSQYLFTRDRVMTVAAGDNIGASPLVSAAFHDEPTIEIENALGLDLSSVGNHEFDEGVTELKRIQNGGCHPTDGCQDGDPYFGASWPFLAANVVDKVTRQPIFPAYSVNTIRGVKVGFIGETLQGTGGIVNPAGVSTVDFLDEATTANFYANKLRTEQGVQAFVLLIHQGGSQATPAATTDPNGCAGFTGDLTPIVSHLDPAFGVVISGHTHRYYTCSLPNSGGNSLVTSAGTAGILVTDVHAELDRTTGRFLSAGAQNVLVENSVRNSNGTFTLDPSKADPVAKRIADKYRRAVASVANRVVGSITADITPAANASGESALGDVIGDAQLAYTTSAGAQIALMNPGGIRNSLVFANSPGGEAPGQITYGESFAVQPFNNLVVTSTFTGQQLKDVLEQQFGNCFGQVAGGRILQVSASLTYTWSAGAACGSKVSGLKVNGTPIDLAASYRVTTNDFLINGGDGFSRLTVGTNRTTAPGFDVDALNSYLGAHSPVAPGPQNRYTMVA